MCPIPNRLPHTSRRRMTTRIIYDSPDGFIVRYIILYYYCVCRCDFLLSFSPAASRMPFIIVRVNSQRYYLYNIVQCLRGERSVNLSFASGCRGLQIPIWSRRQSICSVGDGATCEEKVCLSVCPLVGGCAVCMCVCVCVQLLVIFYRSKNMCRVHRRIYMCVE